MLRQAQRDIKKSPDNSTGDFFINDIGLNYNTFTHNTICCFAAATCTVPWSRSRTILRVKGFETFSVVQVIATIAGFAGR